MATVARHACATRVWRRGSVESCLGVTIAANPDEAVGLASRAEHRAAVSLCKAKFLSPQVQKTV